MTTVRNQHDMNPGVEPFAKKKTEVGFDDESGRDGVPIFFTCGYH